MSYYLTKTLPSCIIEKKLLLDLESYLQRKIQEFASTEDTPAYHTYKFTIVDSSGMETLNNVSEFQRAYFPDDTLRMKLESANRGKNILSIEIGFATIKDLSKLEIRYDGTSAREVTAGIASEIFSILESYKTSNRWWHLFPGSITMLILIVLAASVVSIDKDIFRSVPSIAPVIIGSGSVLVMLQIIPHFMPYSTFETRRNEKRKKQVSWIILGVLGFILFTVIGVYFRLKMFGF